MSTGDRTILGRISKRGNRYLRTLLMQGARVILLAARLETEPGVFTEFKIVLPRASQR
jgi:transposase